MPERVVRMKATGIGPFLKWAGGKRWLLPEIRKRVSVVRDTYYEPFLGGGAVFFGLAPGKAVLADVNPDLVELYETIRDEPDALHERLSVHQAKHCEEHYYHTRACNPATPLERAARMLYLNRTCFNGLWRVNRRGEFNVPMGTKTTVVFDQESFADIAASLKNVELLAADFEETMGHAGDGDLVYVDPPYTVAHNHNGFVKYNDEIFGWSDQERLLDGVAQAAERGARVLVSNANHDSIRELYRGVGNMAVVPRHSVIAGPAQRRGPTTELLISVGF